MSILSMTKLWTTELSSKSRQNSHLFDDKTVTQERKYKKIIKENNSNNIYSCLKDKSDLKIKWGE